MNTKRFALACIAAYVVYHALGYLIHEVWLAPVYEEYASVFRPSAEMDSMMWIFFVTSAVLVVMFCFIFTRGYENQGIGEGIRYGIYMGLFFMVVSAYDSYVIYPLPYSLTLKWFLSGMGIFIVMGIVVSLIYKSEEG